MCLYAAVGRERRGGRVREGGELTHASLQQSEQERALLGQELGGPRSDGASEVAAEGVDGVERSADQGASAGVGISGPSE